MPLINVSEEEVVALARQLPPSARRALAVALLRAENGVPDLDELRRRSRSELASLFRERGLEMERMSAEEIDRAIQSICEEP